MQLPKSLRPASAKNGVNGKQVVHVQTLQFNIEVEKKDQTQVIQNNKLKKVNLQKNSNINPIKAPRSGSPENQFGQFMQQKMQNNSDVKRLYDDENSNQKNSRKPFQIQKSRPTEENENESKVSAQTEFTLNSQNSKKPYGNFYKNYKPYDTNAPTKKQIANSDFVDNDQKKQTAELTITNPSLISTEKSLDVYNTQLEDDAISITSSQGNVSQGNISRTSNTQSSKKGGGVEQQNFKNFVQMKKQRSQQIQEPIMDNFQSTNEQTSVNFRNWTVNEQQLPSSSRLQTPQYQSVMDNYENIINNSTQKRSEYLKKLDGYIQMVKGGQLEKKEKKPQKIHQNQELEDNAVLEKEIRKLAKVLRQKEAANTEKQATLSVNSLHCIAEEPIENLSNLTAQGLRDRSMFVTELMKNRSRLQNQLNKVEDDQQNDHQSLNSSYVSDTLSELEARASKQQKKNHDHENQRQDKLHPELQSRLNSLLVDTQFDQNPFDMLKTAERKQQWASIHTKLKQHNKTHQEFESLELHDELLPKDKFLRQEALDRIIKIRGQEVNSALQEIALKSQGALEDKYKIKDLVDKLQSSGMSRQEVLNKFPEMQEEIKNRAQRFLDLQEQEQQVLDILAKFNPQEALDELSQLKQELEEQVKLSKVLQQEIEQDPRYQLAQTIQEKKVILTSLELECQELNGRAEKLFAFEAFVLNMQAEDDPVCQEEIQDQSHHTQQVTKSIEDYDLEITQKLKDLQPDLFDYVNNII